jgi:hypothetical protein
MALKIVHFSITPLAGGPYRLVSVFRRQASDCDVRLIDLRRWGAYPQDVIFEESPEESLALVRDADVIHLHNYIDLRSKDFSPIDFEALRRSGKAILRQFRTAPATLEKKVGIPIREIISGDVPSIVIAQYPERYYPNAFVVPNAVPSQQPEYECSDAAIEQDVCYSPSGLSYAWTSRWDTKGGPETIDMLNQVQRETGSRHVVVSGRPLSEVLALKRVSRLVIDDLVTGSYHASGLEGLCLGKAVLCYLDQRTERVFQEVTGSATIPFLNTRLEDAGAVLMNLLPQTELTRSIGIAGRQWIDTYWSEAIIVERYRKVYLDLLEDPARVRRQECLRLDDPIRHFFAVVIPDLTYYARGNRYNGALSAGARIRKATKQRVVRLKQWARKCLPKRGTRSQPEPTAIRKP